MQHTQCIQTCRDVVEHDSGSFRKLFQLANGRRLDDIEGSKKYKTRKKSFPCERSTDKSDELADNFIDDYELWVFLGESACHPRGRRDADQSDSGRENDDDEDTCRLRHVVCKCGP